MYGVKYMFMFSHNMKKKKDNYFCLFVRSVQRGGWQ